MVSFVILNLLILVVLGSGFSTLFKPKGDITQQISLSGVIGFSFVSVLLTSFIQADIRPSHWFWLVLAVLSIACGAVFLALAIRKHRPKDVSDLEILLPRGYKSIWLPPIVATGAVLLIGLATLTLGGSAFHMLRGNGTDSFNYATIAMALERLPLSVFYKIDAQTLIGLHPSLGLAKSLLTTRWGTGAILGWCAGISGSAAVEITFAFGFLCLVLAVGPCFLIARLISLNPWQAAGLTVAILTGFWAQVVLDMQALSHLHALPIAFLWTFLVIEIQGQPWKSWMAKGGFLLMLATCALALAYPEFLPFLFLGWTLHSGWMMGCRRVRLSRVIANALPVVSGLALALLLSPFLIDFLRSQLHYAAIGINSWHHAYFSWLYKNPLAGVWGLTHIDTGYLYTNKVTSATWGVFTTLLGFILILAAAIFLAKIARERGRYPAGSLIAALIISGLLQGLVLLILNQWWAAGKAVSFVVPFLWLGAGWAVFTWPKQPEPQRQSAVAQLIRVVGIIWVASQIWLGIARIGIAATDSDYKDYMSHHGFYRQHDWSIRPFTQALANSKDDPIALITEDIWLGEYISLSLGNRWPIRFATNLLDRAGNPLRRRSDAFRCRYLLVDRHLYPEFPDRKMPPPLAETKDFVLFDVGQDAPTMPVLAAVQNSNGLERAPKGIPFLWLGGRATTIWVGASMAEIVVLAGNWQPGPSLPEKIDRTLEVINDEDGTASTFIIQPTTMGVTLQLRRGLNQFTLRVLEQPTCTSLPNGDARPLLLGLLNPHLETSPLHRQTAQGKIDADKR